MVERLEINFVGGDEGILAIYEDEVPAVHQEILDELLFMSRVELRELFKRAAALAATNKSPAYIMAYSRDGEWELSLSNDFLH
jgi:hypothetical protein